MAKILVIDDEQGIQNLPDRLFSQKDLKWYSLKAVGRAWSFFTVKILMLWCLI